MGALAFDKYEGLGNDFLVVEASSEAALAVARAQALCDRHFGVGGDGVLLVLPPRAGGDARMKVINSDGSIPEMCGNGLRCVALHVARARGQKHAELTLETDAGTRRCTVNDQDDGPTVTVDMGAIRVFPDRTLEVAGEPLVVTPADAGNPHAIAFRAVSASEFARLGPLVARHQAFPHGTNAEFAVVGLAPPGSPPSIDLKVWERGAGPTLACGTGACATAAVASAKGLVPYEVPVTVRLPGGPLAIRIDRATGHAVMRGPARHVFSARTSF